MIAVFKLTPYFNEDISNWNVSKVQTMDDMFQNTSIFN
jgi:hypothetical protein